MAESKGLTEEHKKDLSDMFNGVDMDGNGSINLHELGEALGAVNIKMAGYEIRNLLDKYDENKDGKISMKEFERLYISELKKRDFGINFKKQVTTRKGVRSHEGTSKASSEGTTHSVKDTELVAFTDWINRSLENDEDCKPHLPLSGDNLTSKTRDGIILCKLLNKTQEDLIDERTINKTNLTVFRKHENLTLALNSAQSIGCSIVNIGAEDIEKGKMHLVLGLIWQIIRMGLLNDINLAHYPGLVLLLEDGEDISVLSELTPEKLLLRWVNYHLKNSGCSKEVKDFSDDIKDSEAYSYLLTQIAPDDANVTLAPMNESDMESRAEAVLCEAEKMGCRNFVTAKDIVDGNGKLNLAFVANLFNTHAKLDGQGKDIDYGEVREETREERTYRNWMNSMGMTVNYLYSDLCNAITIFNLYEKIRPGMVNWKNVTKDFHAIKINFEKLENCNYAVDLAKCINLSVVNIGGEDIRDGNPTITLALVWQLMRAYTLKILTDLDGTDKPIADAEILAWANSKLSSDEQIKSFSDPILTDGRVILSLIKSIRKSVVNDQNIDVGTGEERALNNAKYAISLARKIGARVYALPEDIVEGKKNMIMTVFACLMVVDNPYKQEKQDQQVRDGVAPMMQGLQ